MSRDFWTRRRAAVAAEAEAVLAADARAKAAEGEIQAAARQAEMSEAELLDDLGLPMPETLSAGDDFTAFMRREVPDVLRRRALRVLWRSNPVLANLDGLVDHGEDFTDAATVLPGMKTAYQVGRGMMAHVAALAEATERVLPDAADEAVSDGGEVVTVAADAAPAGVLHPRTPAGYLDEEEAAEASPAPVARHMQFRFGEDAA